MPLLRPAFLLLSALLLSSCGDDEEKKVAFGPDLKQVAGVTNPSGSGSAAAATSTAAKDNDNGSGGGTPKIAGKWLGKYSWSDGTHLMSVSATIEQNGNSLVIRTSKAAPGRLLTGQIRSNGRIRLTDSDDGEIWSTYYGPVSANHVKIADFLIPTPAGHTGEMLQVLDLRR